MDAPSIADKLNKGWHISGKKDNNEEIVDPVSLELAEETIGWTCKCMRVGKKKPAFIKSKAFSMSEGTYILTVNDKVYSLTHKNIGVMETKFSSVVVRIK